MAVTQIRLNKQAKDGSLTADTEGRAKMADNYVTAAKILKSDTFDFATAGGTVKVSTPVAATDAANKQYVDSVAQGLDVKQSVRAATTVAGTLASSFENGDVIDGVTLVTGDRILIKNQASGIENGIYTVNVSGAPTRAVDFATSANVSGAFTFVEEGTVNDDNGWVCTNAAVTAVVGTDSLSFVQFSGAGQIIAGAGLTKSGNTLDVGQNATGAIVVNADDIAWNPDNSTLEITGSGPGTARIKDNGVSTAKIAGGAVTVDKLSDLRLTAGAGLSLNYAAGRVRSDNTVVSVSASSISLTDDSTNFVEVDATGTVSSNVSGFTSGRVPIGTVVTAGGSISTVNDKRAWLDVETGTLSNSNFVDKETPSGTINGSNVTFTLAFTPVSGSEHLYLNGVLQKPGAGNDYTISGATITYNNAPQTGDVLLASYRK